MATSSYEKLPFPLQNYSHTPQNMTQVLLINFLQILKFLEIFWFSLAFYTFTGKDQFLLFFVNSILEWRREFSSYSSQHPRLLLDSGLVLPPNFHGSILVGATFLGKSFLWNISFSVINELYPASIEVKCKLLTILKATDFRPT